MVNGNNRQLHGVIAHAIQHIKNGSYEFAINLLENAVKEDNDKVRESDKNGKHTDGKS